MDIRLFDFDFNLLAIVSDIISSAWSLKYNAIGTYEGHFRLSDRISDIFFENRYLIIVEGDKQAVCTGKVATDELLVCGRTVNWLLEKRIMPPFKTSKIFEGKYVDPYTIGNMVLQRTFTHPMKIDENGEYIEGTLDTKRQVTNFNLPEEIEAKALDRHFWRNGINSVEQIMADIAEMLGRGHRLVFNIKNKSWDFEYISGIERNILVCEKNRNLYDVTYTEDLQDHASGGWYEIYSSEDTGVDSDSSDTALTEREARYIQTDSSLSGMRYWEAALAATGASEAESTISKKKLSSMVQGSLLKLEYLTDYALGDILTVLIEYGGVQRKHKYRITGVNFWINEQGSGQEPVLEMLED